MVDRLARGLAAVGDEPEVVEASLLGYLGRRDHQVAEDSLGVAVWMGWEVGESVLLERVESGEWVRDGTGRPKSSRIESNPIHGLPSESAVQIQRNSNPVLIQS